MSEPFTLETACAAIEALLNRMKKDLGPEHMEKISGLIQATTRIDNKSIIDEELVDRTEEEAISITENPIMDEEMVTLTGDEAISTESDTSAEEEATTKGKRQKKISKKSNKKLKENSNGLPSPSQLPTSLTEAVKKPLTINNQPPTATTMTPTTIVKTAASTTTKTNNPGLPPIIVFSGNVKEISKYAKEMNIQITLKNLNKTKTIINTATKDGFNTMKEYLKTKGIENHTFTIREDRKILLILKGVHHTFSAIEVKDELQIEGVPAINVTLFRSRKAKNKTYNSFVVEVSKACEVADIYTKTLILNQKVHWERLQNTDIVQCKNCQRFGHVATNCGRKYVCVKCNEDHKPGACMRKDKDDKVFCANCKEFGHPANYLGCKVLLAKKEEKKKAESQKKAKQDFKIKSVCTLTRPSVSFADIAKLGSTAKPRPQQHQKPAPKPQETSASVPPKKQRTAGPATASKLNLDEEMKEHFGTDLASAMKIARSAVPNNYASLSKEKKSVALATFIFDLCSA